MARRVVVGAVVAAVALAGCVSLEPEVMKSPGEPQAPAKAARTFASPKPPAPLTPPRMGQWSDDGLRYQESEETSGVPLLPFPLFRRRAGTTVPGMQP